VREELVEHPIKGCHLLQVHFQDEAVFSCDAMALCNLRNCLREFHDSLKMARQGPHPNKGHQFVAQVLRIQVEIEARGFL
jgi:hypothetical protein